MALFDKAITFTDIHFGLKNNNKEHNDDCIEFIQFMIETAKKNNIKTCIFMGDYFHNRSSVNIATLNYGQQGMQMLNEYFDNTYFIVGNHDMYYKNKRDVTSINMAKIFNNIHFIDEMTTIDDCTFIPFMIDEEYQKLPSLKSTYVFGHLELPGYLLNKMTVMPDHGKETEESFSSCKYVFSGHFHKRQSKITSNSVKIIYTGNCFPHNFSDAWDDSRGCMILEHGKEPSFIAWDNAPKYRTCKLSELLENPLYYLCNNAFIKIQVDIPVLVEDLKFIKECFSSNFNIREFSSTYIKHSLQGDVEITEEQAAVASTDEIVIAQINSIDSNVLDKSLLLEIYMTI